MIRFMQKIISHQTFQCLKFVYGGFFTEQFSELDLLHLVNVGNKKTVYLFTLHLINRGNNWDV